MGTGSSASGIRARTLSEHLAQPVRRTRQSGELLGNVHVAGRSDSGKHGNSINLEKVEREDLKNWGTFRSNIPFSMHWVQSDFGCGVLFVVVGNEFEEGCRVQ